MRPRCSVFIAASLDGFIARPDGRVDWLDAVDAEGEDYGFHAFFGAVDTVLLGRATWEVALGFDTWHYGGKRVVVLSRRPRAPRHGETFEAGDPAAVLERLYAAGARHVYLDGGAAISGFLREGLVDDVTVSVIPVVLGEGIRLFQGPLPERPLGLEAVRSWPTGLVQLRYRVGPSPSRR